MFDIAFSELVVIAIVALIVIGPERLPKVARALGALTGRMQKYMAQVKEEVNREARFAELQKLQEEIKSAARVAQQDLQSSLQPQQVNLPLQEENPDNADKVTVPRTDAPNIQNDSTSLKK